MGSSSGSGKKSTSSDVVANEDASKASSIGSRREHLTPPKGYRVLGMTIPNYRSPIIQTLIISVVHLLVVGMFNVLSALGGGGQVDPTTNNNASTILYGLFCVLSLTAGSVCNYLGPKVTLAAGGVGYSLYSASFWSYNHNKNQGFVYFGGAACGVAAAFLWAAEGALIMSLPMEKDKGKYISLFYGLSFFGTVIGSIIPTVENWDVTTAGSVNDATYIVLFVLMLAGSALAMCISSPSKVIRKDGSRVLIPRQTTLAHELKNIIVVLKREPLVMLAFPYSFAGLWYIPYQSNDYNGYFFNLRSRAFSGVWFNFGQFVMAVGIGFLLDLKYFSRRKRAFIGWTFLFTLITAVFIGGVFPMQESERGVPPSTLIDVTHDKAGPYMTLYAFYGAVDGAWQTFAWWILGALSNDPLVLSMYSAFYKVFSAMGAAIVFNLDSRGISYQDMFGSYWGLLAGSMLLILLLIYLRVDDTTKSEILETSSQRQRSSETERSRSNAQRG